VVLERHEHPISRRDIDPNVLKILYRLINADYVAYLVGGGVRDLMIGLRPKDFDIATSAHPHQIRALFRNSRLIGRRFRLVHVFFGPHNIEVATFRQMSESLEGDDPIIHHDNTFGTPEEDAFRRDFTVNGLFYDPRTFRVIDFVGGVGDLRDRLIRTIGEPELRMREDPVRMIRAVRLAAKLDFEIEPVTQRAIEGCAPDLTKASVPRLVEEIYRTLSMANSARALLLMEALGLLDAALPILAQHLKPYRDRPESAPTVRMIGALGEAIRSGFEPPRCMLLACLFADLHLSQSSELAAAHGFALSEALRARGFSRADTEQARLLLYALRHMLKPSKITWRLARRPYFTLARRLFELVAPIVEADPCELDRFLTAPREHHPRTRRPDGAQSAAESCAPAPRRPRRRGRRGRHRRPHANQPSVTAATESRSESKNGAVGVAAGVSPPATVADDASNDH
jgi:poly(A) polymerase